MDEKAFISNNNIAILFGDICVNFKKEFHYEIFLASFIGCLFFGMLQYLICELFYKDTKSLKVNLMLIM